MRLYRPRHVLTIQTIKYEKTAIHNVERKNDNMNRFSQRGLAQFGTVKYRRTRIGHETTNFTLLITPPAGTTRHHITAHNSRQMSVR